MRHTLNINGTAIQAIPGDTLLDAALAGKILIPHDCATGQCETCRVRVAWGQVDERGTAYGDTVLGCQARVVADATITYDIAPEVTQASGIVESITPLSDAVLEVAVRTSSVVPFRPGQYARLAFRGFPEREYSFSALMNGDVHPDLLVFHIRRLNNGRVSSEIGNGISIHHKVRVTGPYGSAFLREQETGSLVLASSGTGFAPMWSLARAVVASGQNRSMQLVTGIRTPKDAYMIAALRWLRENSNTRITIAVANGNEPSEQRVSGLIAGTADQALPELNASNVVHVAGNPLVVERTRQAALEVGARCYADPFTPSKGKLSWRDRLRFLNAG